MPLDLTGIFISTQSYVTYLYFTFFVANQQQGIIIDENNAQEVCEKIKHKKVTALILKSKKKVFPRHKQLNYFILCCAENKLRGEGMQIISRSLIEDPMCDIKFLDIGRKKNATKQTKKNKDISNHI